MYNGTGDMNQCHRHRRKKGRGRLTGKLRFRAIVRQVIDNRAWLEEAHLSKGVDDVIKKNVLMIDIITREKYQSLTLANKSLLRKDARLRTENDIETLYKVIGNLKCFRRYPENVRMELVASTYFEYYGPDRVIVKQSHESTFLGFVLRGELEVTFTKVDPVFGKLVTEVTTHLLPGAVFGEVSLLHNIPRTATVTSLTAVELLILKKDDFDRVLKASMQKQWDEISSALKQFPYFDNWNDVATRECCMLSDTMMYTTHEIILGKGYGKLTSAHFVLSGTCSMIQRLMVSQSSAGFKLQPPDIVASGTRLPCSQARGTMAGSVSPINRSRAGPGLLRNNTSQSSKTSPQARSASVNLRARNSLSAGSHARGTTDDASRVGSTGMSTLLDLKSNDKLQPDKKKNHPQSGTKPGHTKASVWAPMLSTAPSGTDLEKPNIQPLFMQVCLFNKGGCFNLGESLQERTVVADCDVRILRIPLYLLRQHNVANIWHRIRQFLESRLSSEEELFRRFLETRKWNRYKREICGSMRNPETLNDTTVHDAPYYWRVLDMELRDGKPCQEDVK